MNDISICLTVKNEEENISLLLESLVTQTIVPGEIVIVDAGSTDNTIKIITSYKNKYPKLIKLIIDKGVSRAKGRNIAVKNAKSNIVAMTDAGCIADNNWLKWITDPFKKENDIVVAGFYKMSGKNDFQRAMAVFLGVMPKDFSDKFLPSTRSIAFSKSVWEKVGGFPEDLPATAEDTVFSYKVIKNNVKLIRVKKALVEWGMPQSLSEYYSKVREYAKGDAMSNIWWNPAKRLKSHNIKVLLVFIRYFLGLGLVVLSVFTPHILVGLFVMVMFYIFWSFTKVYEKYKNLNVALFGPVLQITSDFGVLRGFVQGIIFMKR